MNGVDPTFADTNLLLYSVDAADPVKQRRAEAWLTFLWSTRTGVLSWQVLNEFYANAVRKLGLPVGMARDRVETLAGWVVKAPGLAQQRRAWFWSDRASLSYWDALIVAAAEETSCRWLLSEDFQEGRRFDLITVVNPFLTAPPSA